MNPAFLQYRLHILGNINVFAVFGCLKSKIFRVEFHRAIITIDMDPATARILIVDDEPSLLKMMSVYLGRLGYAITTSNTTDRAWAELQADPSAFSVAVLDATMDGLSMEDLALRALGASPKLCILAASGYPVDMTALEAAAPGRVLLLHKPFTPEMLAAAVRRMLAAQEEEL